MQRLLLACLRVTLICVSLTGGVFAQATPRFVSRPPRYLGNLQAPATPTITNWTGNIPGVGNVTMVGTDPSSTNTTTTVTAYLVPTQMVMETASGNFPPLRVLPNRRTVVQNTALSPIFNSGIDFVRGGVDLGNTQYIDAYQRGNFWSYVSTNSNYHTLLNLVVLPMQTIVVPPSAGSVGNEFGVRVAPVDINFFDAKWPSIISSNPNITPNSFSIAVTYDTYLTQGGGCCIGSYHSSFGSAGSPQTYAHFTYIDKVGVFSQDVSALSHKVGE